MPVTIRYDIDFTINGVPYRFASAAGDPPTITIGDDAITGTLELAAAASATLWAAASSPLTTFDFAIIVATKACELELTANDGNAAENLFVITLAPGVPFILGSEDTYFSLAAGEDGFTGGSADVIDKLRIKNIDTEDDAAISYALLPSNEGA